MTDLAKRFGYLLTTMHQSPEKVKLLVLAMVDQHNIMRTRYPGVQNALQEREGDDHHLFPGLWRTNVVIQEMDEVMATAGET